jgi:methylated-DNA-[protein]-cysteine S-methyltransferase
MTRGTATTRIASPVGPLTLCANDRYLLSLRIGRTMAVLPQPGPVPDHDVLRAAERQVHEWFAGERQDFDLPLAPPDSAEGATLRHAIASIPYGQTMTYGLLAQRIGSVARAIGQACKTNPFPIIIPCHRVISTSGPEYYSGGNGPHTKTWLLDFEYANLPSEKRTRLL